LFVKAEFDLVCLAEHPPQKDLTFGCSGLL